MGAELNNASISREVWVQEIFPELATWVTQGQTGSIRDDEAF